MSTFTFTVTMATDVEDDLAPTKTEGFKVGEKKTVEEYTKLGRLNVLWSRVVAALLFSPCPFGPGPCPGRSLTLSRSCLALALGCVLLSFRCLSG